MPAKKKEIFGQKFQTQNNWDKEQRPNCLLPNQKLIQTQPLTSLTPTFSPACLCILVLVFPSKYAILLHYTLLNSDNLKSFFNILYDVLQEFTLEYLSQSIAFQKKYNQQFASYDQVILVQGAEINVEYKKNKSQEYIVSRKLCI